jgi:hypothetical protein
VVGDRAPTQGVAAAATAVWVFEARDVFRAGGAGSTALVVVCLVAAVVGWLLGRRYPRRPDWLAAETDPRLLTILLVPVVVGFFVRSGWVLAIPGAAICWQLGVLSWWQGRHATHRELVDQLHEARRFRRWLAAIVALLLTLAIVTAAWSLAGLVGVMGLPTLLAVHIVVRRAEGRLRSQEESPRVQSSQVSQT